MTTAAETDVINSATPLELRYEGVHPRLYADAEQLDVIRSKLHREPYAGILKRVLKYADGHTNSVVPSGELKGDVRSYGCALAHFAAAHRMTGETKYLDAAHRHLDAMTSRDNWGNHLVNGHWGHGAAVAYDWLYHDLDPALRQQACDALYRNARNHFDFQSTFMHAASTAYAWNAGVVPFSGMVFAALAVWGDTPNVGPILRMATEKTRTMVDSLGSDGASPEGVAYGLYYNAYMLRVMALMEQLLGNDMFDGCAFYENYPLFLQYAALSRDAWTLQQNFMQWCDSNGQTWYSPDPQLRIIARHFRDGRAQWLAHTISQAGVASDRDVFLNLLWHDETVEPIAPDDLPTQRHLRDKDIVLGRSGWDGSEATYVFKCGPNSGYHAKRRYKHDASGTHMHPDAGHFLLHSHGQWLIIDEGYPNKFTKYQNTVLVNGVGQVGEGGHSFEDLEIRRGHPEGRILHASTSDKLDIAIGDVAPIYKAEAKLTKFLRHVLFVKPDVWVIVDELSAAEPSTFEARWHLSAKPEAADDATWRMVNSGAGLLVKAMGPTATTGQVIVDPIEGFANRKPTVDIDTLTLSNTTQAKAVVFVTVLHAFDAKTSTTLNATLTQQADDCLLTLTRDGKVTTLTLKPGQSDPSTAIVTLA